MNIIVKTNITGDENPVYNAYHGRYRSDFRSEILNIFCPWEAIAIPPHGMGGVGGLDQQAQRNLGTYLGTQDTKQTKRVTA